MIGLAMVLVVVVEMACVAKLLTEVRLDGQMVRLALVATIPLFATFSLFFMIVITGSLFQLFGPMPESNSRFYSCESISVHLGGELRKGLMSRQWMTMFLKSVDVDC